MLLRVRSPRRGDWQPDYGGVCLIAHASLGAFIGTLPTVLFGRSFDCVFWGFVLAVAWAVVKEGGFDTLWFAEPPAGWPPGLWFPCGEGDSWANSWQDFREYLLGAFAGLAVTALGTLLK